MDTKDYLPYAYPPAWFEEVSKLNIYQRLHGAMADVKPLSKTAKDGIKFKFHGHEAVSTLVKGVAEKWRFVVEASAISHDYQIAEIYGKPRPLCILNVRVRFVNIDNPTDFTECVSVGYGVDESDKGPGKALSYALKMACLKAFLIYDGEPLDNEMFCYQHEREEKAMADARQEWARLVKALKLDMKEQGERMKAEYGNPPPLDAIQIDIEELRQVLAEETEREKKKPKGTTEKPKNTESTTTNEAPDQDELFSKAFEDKG